MAFSKMCDSPDIKVRSKRIRDERRVEERRGGFGDNNLLLSTLSLLSHVFNLSRSPKDDRSRARSEWVSQRDQRRVFEKKSQPFVFNHFTMSAIRDELSQSLHTQDSQVLNEGT